MENHLKRPAEGPVDASPQKKQRSDAATDAVPLTPAAIAALLQQKKDELAKRANVRPDDIQEKLAKARRLQQQIQQQQQQLQSSSADVGRTPRLSGDAGRHEGRGGLQTAVHPSLQKDANGNLMVRPIDPTNLVPRLDFSTTKANQRIAAQQQQQQQQQQNAPPKKNAYLSEPVAEEEQEWQENPYFDPRMVPRAPKGRVAPTVSAVAPERRERSLRFIQKGKYTQQANQQRQAAQMDALKEKIALQVRKAGLDADMELVDDKMLEAGLIPDDAEWWDQPFLVHETYDDLDLPEETGYKLDELITQYIQHPVPLRRKTSDSAAKPMRLMLTKKEQKKLRKRRRFEALKDKQDQQRVGLLPMDPPKLKMSNVARVLTNEYIADPTKIEAEVRQQVESRKQKHEEENAARAVSGEEKKRRKTEKLLADQTDAGILVAVFKIRDFSSPAHRFKVDANATELLLNGVAIKYSDCSIVIVEGGPKGIRKFKRLMLQRINWQDLSAADASMSAPQEGPNRCALVWEGFVKHPQFQKFRMKALPTEGKVRELLRRCQCEEYFELVKNYTFDE